MMRLRNAVPAALIAALASSGAFAQEDPPVQLAPIAQPVPQEVSETPILPEPVEAPDKDREFRIHSSMRVPEPGQEVDPEVAIAEAQVREAEARLRQARIAAAQREIEMEQLKRIVELARKNAKEQQNRAELGIGTQPEQMEAQERLARAEAEVAKLEAASHIRSGRSGIAGFPDVQERLFEQPRFPAPRPKLSDDDKATEVELSLREPVSIEFEQETLRNVAGFIDEYVNVNIVLDVALRAADEKISIKLDDVPLEDCLMAIADAYGDLCFVIRDYGIFATTTERAMTINAPTIPANIPLLVSFQDAPNRGVAVGMFGRGPADFGGGGGGFGMGSGPGGAGGGFGGGFGSRGDTGSVPGGRLRGGFGGGGGFVPSQGSESGHVDAQEPEGKSSTTQESNGE